ncbi:bifunctional metallophosphatase/5'-nucleotidase [Blastococcus haudaquaticus]|uniref:2',3'-cyclic-nucleotide 2'-phosphodiesterase/5'-or 3'-nucleotidase, 5'-nucleotidase family n=1 Tax=Blastococcus haudaquaticus TaxID=1938745 RepID=A0A286H6G1_9ACTN|nr:bifunctional UDP-sugar hydrolase/5'-nucleotidase [Blastococcus haudaquaticus]SOE03357.1 2',3'-cyclic-nucleotide 2'-phosphodiesterase/5'-or 3'-nucleotidase, 5'-nucleotidase family [Blastococcus haudaquaticus]
MHSVQRTARGVAAVTAALVGGGLLGVSPALAAPADSPVVTEAPAAVGNPTGVANGNSWVHPQDRVAYIAGHFVNTDSVPVQVRMLTGYGDSDAQTVAPGAAAYLTKNTGLAELPAGTATLRVYKNVGGKGYQSLFPISYPAQSAGDGGDGITELQLLGINDFHGRLTESAVRLAGTVEEQRAREGVDATLLLSSGDNIGASTFVSSVQQDAPTLEVLNEMGLQASAVGNHEFDQGFDDLVGRVGVDGETGLADFPHLGANVYRNGAPALPEYALLDAAGVSVGVIGVVTEETRSLVSPAGIEGITFGDPVEATNRVVTQLTDGTGDEADVIVLLAHEGAPGSASLAAELAKDTAFTDIVNGVDADVDAIFTGHTHQRYAWEAPVPGEEGTRPVIQTGSYGAALGRIGLTYDEGADEVTAFTVDNLDLTTRPAAELTAAYERVAAVAATVAEAKTYADAIGNEVIGSVTADITRAFTPAGTEDRGSYSALGGLLADSYVYGSELSAIEPADLGLINPGGLRADLRYGEDGQITLAEANAVTPFANDLVVTTLTGEQLVEVLEQQWQPAGSTRPFLALGASEELTWSYDPAAAPGERIHSVRVSGEPLDLTAGYRVATNSFLASGGDNFTAFAEGTTEGTGLIDFDSFQAYLEDNSPLSPENYTGRVTVGEEPAPTVPTPAAAVTASSTTVAPRDRVTISVTGFGPSERVTVTLGSDQVGRVRTNAEGAGSVEVRVPRGTRAGAVDVVATGTDSDRTATVQLQVTGAEQPGNGGGNGSNPGLGQFLSTLQELLRNLVRGWFGG